MNRSRRWIAHALVALMAATALPGCGYSLSGRGSFLPAYIKSIGVPQFTNNTSVFEVERRVTDAVRSELIGRAGGKYKVENVGTGVDGLLTGEITSITATPSAFNDQRQATRLSLVLTARVEFRDVKADKVLWSNAAMQFREEYPVTTATNAAEAVDPNALFGQDVTALTRLSTEFARALVSAILEAF
jgi:hypothetical protein